MLFKNLSQYQRFYLDTKCGRISFIKIGGEAKVLHSEHFYFVVNSFKKFNPNTLVKENKHL